jgi:phosphoglycerate dehydrogenase-like enzyme
MTQQPLRVHIENDSAIGPLFTVTPELLAAAEKRHPAVAGRWTATFGEDGEGFTDNIAQADALLAWSFPKETIGTIAPRLSWIQLTGAGVDHLLPLDWLPPTVTLTNARGAHKPKIGEALMMAILMLNNFIPALLTHQRRHEWQQRFSTGIAGKTLLVVGLGEAGVAAAEMARRFGMRVIATARRKRAHPAADAVHPPERLKELLPQADIVLVTVPLTSDTHGLIGAHELGLMKRGAGLVNLARHGVVDDAALIAALEREHLSGCVYDLEDPAERPFDSRLWNCRNLVLVPHSLANDRDQFTANVLDIFFRNLAHRLAGRPLDNRVDPALGY